MVTMELIREMIRDLQEAEAAILELEEDIELQADLGEDTKEADKELREFKRKRDMTKRAIDKWVRKLDEREKSSSSQE